MTQIHTSHTDELAAITSTGVPVPLEMDVGVKLGVGTYFVILGAPDSMIQGTQVCWDATVAGVVSYEVCNLPRKDANRTTGVSDFDVTGLWVHYDPTTAYIPSATGATIANATLTILGTTLNSTMFDVGNSGAKRHRLKIVTTVGGYMRFATLGKM